MSDTQKYLQENLTKLVAAIRKARDGDSSEDAAVMEAALAVGAQTILNIHRIADGIEMLAECARLDRHDSRGRGTR